MAEKNMNFDEIIVDDGGVEVPIRNTQGEEIGVFHFNPTDIGIIERYNKVADEFDNVVAPLESIEVAQDATAEEKEAAEQTALKDATERLYTACNYLFGGDFASAFFGKVHPFSPVNGHFYCENALGAVGKYISAQFDQEVKKVNSRVERYTHGYRTGKHKDGKR